jgi:hypothetical protein
MKIKRSLYIFFPSILMSKKKHGIMNVLFNRRWWSKSRLEANTLLIKLIYDSIFMYDYQIICQGFTFL